AQELVPVPAALTAVEESAAGRVLHARGRDPYRTLFKSDSDTAVEIAVPGTDVAEVGGLLASSSAPVLNPPELAYAPGLDRQSDQKPPERGHTGFKALAIETGIDFAAYPRRRSTWVILAIGGGAATLARPLDDDVNEKLAGSDTAGNFFAAGKYIGAVYTQAGVAVALYVVGRYMQPHEEGTPRTSKTAHLGFDMLHALLVSQALTPGIKFAVQRDRPTGECCAFPSGHASAAFATASVVERHLGYRGSWPMFLIASYVATSRLSDNRHYLSDVVFGAAVGISSGWTVVGRHGRLNFALTPVPVRGGMMVALTRKSQDPSQVDSRGPAR
ncbi:MAG TPA: phosphatase PAP2 family protein, partial [Vicinamibacterales bacterium]|nr:phosphatase PAP2 family protein [Vicinamibacterales bacterium]